MVERYVVGRVEGPEDLGMNGLCPDGVLNLGEDGLVDGRL